MALQAKMDAFKKEMEAQAPAEALAIMHRATRELADSGILDKAVKVGERAPAFALENTSGEPVSLESLVARGPVVLSFYRGKW